MSRDGEVFQEHLVSFFDSNSTQYIHTDLFQKLDFPQQYPAFIQVHLEEPSQDVPLHWHPGSELIYSRNRELTVIIDGKRYLLPPGDFILISSYALHAVLPSPSDVPQDTMSISFQVSYLERMMPNLSHLTVDRHAPGATEADVAQMKSLCEQLRRHVDLEWEDESRYFETNKLLYSILDLMYTIFCTGERDHTRGNSSPNNRLFEVVLYLEDHYRENLTTQNVADHFGYSREYFCRLFKRYFNQTFKQYLTEVRLNAAVKDLRMTERGVGQIGIECGFPDEKSFFAAFKKKYGMTPAQYRTEL